MKKILILLSLLLLASVLLIGCGETPAETTGDSTEETTTAAVTTDPPTPEELLAENQMAKAGLEMALKVCKRYYNLKTHELRTSLTQGGATVIWPYTAYVEMVAEAYRLYPDNKDLETYYRDAIDQGLEAYKVTNATIKPPSGEVYTGITYYNAGRGSAGDFYYDDNAWVCIQLLDAYQQLGDKKFLDRAEELLTFFWTGYDQRAGGGIYWSKAFDNREGKYGDGLHYKGGCTNNPIGICYAAAYQITKNPLYLERAKMQYDWVTKVIRDKTGLVHEGASTYSITEYDASKVSNWTPAYDQGTYMTLASLLYEITGEQEYFDNMKQTAMASVSLMFQGQSKMKGNPIFKSWCIGWIVRGEMSAYKVGYTQHSATFMTRMNNVLKLTIKETDKFGHYDPYFLSGEWWDFEANGCYDHDVMQPAGVATTLLLTGRYQCYQNPNAKR